jgi:hypothetical protein
MARAALTIMAAIIVAGFIFVTPARAMSVQDFDKLSDAQQAHFITDFIEKMTADIGTKNPELAQQIRHYFYSVDPSGKAHSEGLERVTAELIAVDMQAKDGRADPSQTKVESVIVWVVKQKFPPQGA